MSQDQQVEVNTAHPLYFTVSEIEKALRSRVKILTTRVVDTPRSPHLHRKIGDEVKIIWGSWRSQNQELIGRGIITGLWDLERCVEGFKDFDQSLGDQFHFDKIWQREGFESLDACVEYFSRIQYEAHSRVRLIEWRWL
ncbi:MAG: hypothetical protein QM523_00600 [Candidatus Pacebacteria bacterium]|nr:hypothetical protein [Candidatus Paceibacterota bacterium]